MRETRLTSTQPSRHIERSEKEDPKGTKKKGEQSSAQETRGTKYFGTPEISTTLNGTPQSHIVSLRCPKALLKKETGSVNRPETTSRYTTGERDPRPSIPDPYGQQTAGRSREKAASSFAWEHRSKPVAAADILHESPMPVLQRRTQTRPAADAAVASGSRSGGRESTALPPYEPLLQPLNEASKRRLQDLTNGRETKKLGLSIDKSVKYLQSGVGNINDRAVDRHRIVSALAQRRQVQARQEGGAPEEKSSREVRAEESAAKADDVALDYTRQTERNLRRLVDLRVELEDEGKVVASVQQQLEQQSRDHQWPERPARRQKRRIKEDSEGEGANSEMDVDQQEEEEEEEEEENPANAAPVIPLGQMFAKARKDQADEYARLTAHARYALNNDYIQFKRTWHDARHPEEDVPLPDASRWFGPDGEPVIKTTKVAVDDDAEADDLVEGRQIRSLKCPLSLQTIKEPYTSSKCSHTFDKANILDFIKTSGGRARCPVAGCDQVSQHPSSAFSDSFPSESLCFVRCDR